MKNIVLCCDGTANEFSDHNTNVVKLYQLLEKDPARQVTYYHPGVGTMEAVGALTSIARKITKILGLCDRLWIGGRCSSRLPLSDADL